MTFAELQYRCLTTGLLLAIAGIPLRGLLAQGVYRDSVRHLASSATQRTHGDTLWVTLPVGTTREIYHLDTLSFAIIVDGKVTHLRTWTFQGDSANLVGGAPTTAEARKMALIVRNLRIKNAVMAALLGEKRP